MSGTENTFISPDWPDLATYDRGNQIGRGNWRVQATSEELIRQSKLAADYHRKREEWWTGERDASKTKLGTEGLQVREQAATGGMQHVAVLDPQLSARLSECEQKIAAHRSKAEQFDRWIAFFSVSSNLWTLTINDIEFFEIGKHEAGT